MTLNDFERNHLMPLHFKGLSAWRPLLMVSVSVSVLQNNLTQSLEALGANQSKDG